LGKGFHQARSDLAPHQTFVVIPVEDRYPLGEDVEVIGVAELAGMLSQLITGGGDIDDNLRSKMAN